MPKFFFDTSDGSLFCDPEGTDLPSIREAQHEALRILCQLLPTHAGDLLKLGAFNLTVSDQDRTALMKLAVSVTMTAAGETELAATPAPPKAGPGPRTH